MEPIAAAIGWTWGDTLDKRPVYRDPFKQDFFSSLYYSSWWNFIIIYYFITWVYVQTRSKGPNPHPPLSSCTNSLSVSVRLSILGELHRSLLSRFSGLRSDVEWRVADLPQGKLRRLNLPRVEATFALPATVVSLLGYDFDIDKPHCESIHIGKQQRQVPELVKGVVFMPFLHMQANYWSGKYPRSRHRALLSCAVVVHHQGLRRAELLIPMSIPPQASGTPRLTFGED